MVELDKLHIDDFTSNVQRDDIEHIVTGDGLFDRLMETATQHLKAQFEGNRLREEDYAAAYIQIYQATLQAALTAWLDKEIKLEQIKLVKAQIDSEHSKMDLYKRQMEAFNDDYKHKVLKIMMDSWAVGFSVAKDNATISVIPDPVTSTKINDLYRQISSDITT